MNWKHGFLAIENLLCVLLPLCASVSSVLTSWDGIAFNSWAEVRLEWGDVCDDTEHRAWHLRMEVLLPTPSICSSGYCCAFRSARIIIMFFLIGCIFPCSESHLPKESQKFTCKHMWPNPGPQSRKTWNYFFYKCLIEEQHAYRKSHKAQVYCLLNIYKLNISLYPWLKQEKEYSSSPRRSHWAPFQPLFLEYLDF